MAQPNDILTRFFLEGGNVRGAIVKLDNTWKNIASRADYPPAIA